MTMAGESTSVFDSSDIEEVRRKPVSQQPPIAVATRTQYCDILVIGKTGTGKSSTVDKLMVLKKPTTGITPPTPKQDKPRIDDEKTVDDHRENPQLLFHSADKQVSVDEIGAVRFKHLRNKILYPTPEDQETGCKRLQQIDFYTDTSSDTKPHIAINKSRCDRDLSTKTYTPTGFCELLKNDDSKLRVLDTPGFSSPNIDKLKIKRGVRPADVNLAIVHSIVIFQATTDLKFNRVLYFLPSVPDISLQEEIEQLLKLYGSSIFEYTILVVPQGQEDTSRGAFQEAFIQACRGLQKDTTGLVEPPMISITMADTCQEIHDKVMSAPVRSDKCLELDFVTKTCQRCARKVGIREGSAVICADRTYGGIPWANSVLYKESRCHPKMKKEIIGLKRFSVCINSDCKLGNGTAGCTRVNTPFWTSKKNITVNHLLQDNPAEDEED